MSERRIAVPERVLSYSGYFDGKELYKLIRSWVSDRGYDDWIEREHSEKHVKGKKQVEITYLPMMKISDYIQLQLGIDITYMNVQKTTVEYKGKKVKVDEGDVEIAFTGYIVSDYEDRWENKPNYFFIRTIMDKFVFRVYNAKYEQMLSEHIKELFNDIREYLNTTKHT